MQYRLDKRSGNELSVLGFGCMRFPRKVNGVDSRRTDELVRRAIELGVNYFDTAYLYPGSEGALGEALQRLGMRERVYIATKLPLGQCRTTADFGRLFRIQLDTLNTDYIDYYLMHNINSLDQWQELCTLGIREWIAEQKAAGSIREIGFSFHGAREQFVAVIEAYDWDFCQIQYNYANEHYQAGVEGLHLAASKGIAVMIMEPLLGGKLANGLAPAARAQFRNVNNNSPAVWGLRWLWNQPEVTVVLSGMSEMSQLEDNVAAADDVHPDMLSASELAAYDKALEVFRASDRIPCTGCGYCMPCPAGVNIPGCFASHNASYSHGFIASYTMYVTSTAANRSSKALASSCIKCGKCEAHCPQNIPIRKSLEEVTKHMEPFYFNGAMKVVRWWMRREKKAK